MVHSILNLAYLKKHVYYIPLTCDMTVLLLWQPLTKIINSILSSLMSQRIL